MPELTIFSGDKGSTMDSWSHRNGKVVINYTDAEENSQEYIAKCDREEEKKEESKEEKKEEQLDDIDRALMPTVEDLWKTYDKDGNGYLDK